MNPRSKEHLLLPLLALVVALGTVATVQAEDRSHGQDAPWQAGSNPSATLQITFASTPRWQGIPGTRAQQIRERERPSYDMFRYGGSYYVYNNYRWYRSPRGYGQFILIEDRNVPGEVSRIPRQHWRNYPNGWTDGDRDNGRRGDRRGSGQNGQRDKGRGR